MGHGIMHGLDGGAQLGDAMDQPRLERKDFLYRGIHAVGHRVILPTPLGNGIPPVSFLAIFALRAGIEDRTFPPPIEEINPW